MSIPAWWAIVFFGLGTPAQVQSEYTSPGGTPELFAPGIVSTDEYFEISCTTTPDGNEFYFTRRGGEFGETNTIVVTNEKGTSIG